MHTHSGEKNIWSSADFVRLPTDKEMIVYHFNGKFIWTVRYRTTTKQIQENALKKSY